MMKQDNKELNNKADSLHSIFLSIIIPIFNAEKHLQTLIEVLAKQNVLNEPNFEIFMIDDGSTDNSASIIKGFQNIYTNIHYIYQDNAGMTVARNNGMDRARGEYIYMMDQDDVMVPNTLIPFTKFAKEQNSDVLLFQFKKIKPEEKLGWEEKLQTEPQVIEVTDGAKYIEENDGLMHSELGAPQWSNIYSRKFLQIMDYVLKCIKCILKIQYSIGRSLLRLRKW